MEWVDFSIAVRRCGETFSLHAYQGLPTDGTEPIATEACQTWPNSHQIAATHHCLRTGPSRDALADLGACGAAWLLQGRIGDAFFEQVARLGQDPHKRLRLRLCFEREFLDKLPPEWHFLYWEALCIAAWREEVEHARQTFRHRDPNLPLRIHSPFVALNECISIVRQVLGDPLSSSLAVAEPLRVLVVHCNARQKPIERLDDMLDAFLQAMQLLRTEKLVVCPTEYILRDPQPERVLEALERVNPHVLVTMCHGDRTRFNAQMDGLFMLSDGQGGRQDLYASHIAQRLRHMHETGVEPQLRVVFMPHCLTMAAAPALLAAEVPAVVGMQESIADHQVTVALVDQLFRSLAAFKSLDECLIDVRERLVGHFGDGNPHWCYPTLWLATEDSRLFAPLAEVRKGQYLREVLRTHSGMRIFGHQETVPLDQHYIDAGTQQVKKRPPDDTAPSHVKRADSIPDWLDVHEHTMRTVETINVFEALTDSRPPHEKRYYIAGPPGAGKTTMLKHLVTCFAREALQRQGRLPVYIELRALGEWLLRHGRDPQTALLKFLAQRLQPMTDAQELLARGDVVLCFDGLDEVLEKVRCPKQDIVLRDLVCQSLTWCANTFPQCPLVVTSRLRTCPQALSGFTTLQMKPFDEQDMLTYAKAYFRHVSEVSDDSNLDAEVEAQRFMEALNRNTHLKALAATPLLLSLICYLYRLEGLPLPAGQSQLFDCATLHLLQDNLHRAARIYPEPLKRRVLEAIAYEATIRHTRLTDFRYKDFSQVAVQVLREAKDEFGQVNLHSVLEDIVSNSGLLQRLAGGGYAFLHLSFQEYFAASAMASPQTLQTLSVSPNTVWNFVDKQAWDPEWEPFILFLVGKLPNPRPLLDLLTDELTEEKKDDVFRHRLALAALCLPELDFTKRTTPSVTVAVDCITTVAFSLWRQFAKHGMDAVAQNLTRALPGLGQVNGRMDGIPLLEWVQHRMWDPDLTEQEVAERAVMGLRGAAATAPILTALAERLQAPQVAIRWAAVEALGNLGNAAATVPILTALAELLQAPEVEVRRATVEAVGNLGSAAATAPILTALAELLQAPEVEVRRATVEAVGNLGSAAATAPILTALAGLLQAPVEVMSLMSWAAVRAAVAVDDLGSATVTPAFLTAMDGRLQARAAAVRRAAAAVGDFGSAAATAPILTALAEFLQAPEVAVREAAVEAMGDLGSAAATAPILTALDGRLQARAAAVRRAAAAVGDLGSAAATAPILTALAGLLQAPQWEVRQTAAKVVGNLGSAAATPAFLTALAGLLQAPQWEVRWATARAVATMMEQGVRIFEDGDGGWRGQTVAELCGDNLSPFA